MNSDNPLAGISIPSLADIADQVVDRMGKETLDLSSPLQRHRLKEYIQQAIGMAINFELERALHAASDKAITHVFRIMRDADYQAKKKAAAVIRAKRCAETRAKKDGAFREARMDYSLKKLAVEKKTIQ